MNTRRHSRNAIRFGHWLGRTWRGMLRLRHRAAGWLAQRGLPVGVANALTWMLLLAVLGGLFYGAFWVALLLTFALVGAWLIRNDDGSYDEEQPELRDGHSGVGLYDKDDWRIDMGTPDEL